MNRESFAVCWTKGKKSIFFHLLPIVYKNLLGQPQARPPSQTPSTVRQTETWRKKCAKTVRGYAERQTSSPFLLLIITWMSGCPLRDKATSLPTPTYGTAIILFQLNAKDLGIDESSLVGRGQGSSVTTPH